MGKMMLKITEQQRQWLARMVRNSISHIERHNPDHPARKQMLIERREFLAQLESLEEKQ